MRVDRVSTGGYLVRITRRGQMKSQYFADREYGGKKKALTAARAFRDDLEKKLKGYSPAELAQTPRANNTSGVTGVRYVEETDRRWESQPTYGYYIAQWSPEPGVRKSKRFSIEKYGDDEAMQLAIKAREAGEREMAKNR